MQGARAVGLAGLLCAATAGAQTSQEPVPVFKTGTALVRVDVVVTDKKGAQVRDLTAAEFEIEAEGRDVPVRVASFIPVLSRSVQPADAVGAAAAVPRVLGFYVSVPVLGIEMPMSSQVSTIQTGDKARRVARMLDGFFKTQMASTDLVAIARADSTSIELLSNFGDSRETLEGAGARVGKLSMDAASMPLRIYASPPTLGGRGYIDVSALVEHSTRVLASLDHLISAMAALPGRRLLFFVGGIRLRDRAGGSRGFSELNEPVKALIEHANRAEVTLHAIEPSGLGEASTEDLLILTEGTGGSVIGRTEMLSANLGKILDRNLGYYSLGYEPLGDETKHVQRVRVRVKRNGVRVSTRPVAFVEDRTDPK